MGLEPIYAGNGGDLRGEKPLFIKGCSGMCSPRFPRLFPELFPGLLYIHTAMSYFTAPIHPGGCWVCTHFHGETTDDGCQPFCRYEPQFPIAPSFPDEGCSHWMREPGADDEIKLSDERKYFATAVFPLKR